MRKIIRFVLAATAIVSVSSCALVFRGTRQNVKMQSMTNGTSIYVDGELVGTDYVSQRLKRSKSHTVTFKKDGCNSENVHIGSELSGGWVAWDVINILWLNPIPILCDGISGAWRKLDKTQVTVDLTCQQRTYVEDPTIRAGAAQERVTRDAPGKTTLERTIIRWNFDSDPRGCRIFWRVISSVPDEVKNTNELYLTTTPYEETRSFNILGLTYENSRDVTVEIKLTKKGYEDQVKRYNVRQAIDQQEIGGFFEMVEKVDYDRPAAKPKKKRVVEEEDDE
jgi:hypothetical protein